MTMTSETIFHILLILLVHWPGFPYAVRAHHRQGSRTSSMQSDTLLRADVCLVAMLGDATLGGVHCLRRHTPPVRPRHSFGSDTRGSNRYGVSVGKVRYWVDKCSRSILTDTTFVAGSCLG